MEKTNTNDAKKLIESKELVIIDFFAEWCGPCQMFGPIFAEYAEKNKSIKLIKVDIDSEPDFTMESSVQGVPTIVAFKNGKEIDRFSGFKSLEDLGKFIDSVK